MRAAKVLDGFPLALELAGILIHEGIVPLGDFAQVFTSRYQRLAKHRVDPGMWLWDKSDRLFNVFDDLYKSLLNRSSDASLLLTLCAVFGPWSIPVSLLRGLQFFGIANNASKDNSWGQLQILLDDDVELKVAIEELCKIFSAKKRQDCLMDVQSISLHPSICQWRFETLGEQRADWVMQASFGLATHIKYSSAKQQ
ncbi:hypothetical protein BM221_010292 [Beauveria bassiana]|uniref:Uncharacterized protein n=1 Tax=Beauveria bassiana TaxID=176275 RepID=A0A2N6N9A2_BEABA|nr:hypothetical protein BM221_010292 [Beauveria bassiana]